MTDHLLGIIGGMGPEATIRFMHRVLCMTQAATDQEHVRMLVCNYPDIPDRTGFLLGAGSDDPAPSLLRIGHTLCAQGASLLVMPCITAHYFYPQLQRELPVPIVHGIAEAARYLATFGVKTAGLLATDGTLRTGLPGQLLAAHGIRPVIPSPPRQAEVMHVIYDNCKAGRLPERECLFPACEELAAAGAQAILLGCTELSLLPKKYFPFSSGKCPGGQGSNFTPVMVDILDIMAAACVRGCGKRLRPSYSYLMGTQPQQEKALRANK